MLLSLFPLSGLFLSSPLFLSCLSTHPSSLFPYSYFASHPSSTIALAHLTLSSLLFVSFLSTCFLIPNIKPCLSPPSLPPIFLLNTLLFLLCFPFVTTFLLFFPLVHLHFLSLFAFLFFLLRLVFCSSSFLCTFFLVSFIPCHPVS